jgi:RNA polymerase sigma-70 factor (ECF subfamily)
VNDAQAINRLKRGDIRGLTALIERHQLQAVRIAVLITRDRALAEDVVQTTFLKLYHRIDQFDERRAFAPYFFRSVINAAVQAARQQSRSVSLDAERDGAELFAELLPDSAPSLESLNEAADLKTAVRAALNQLSPEQRAAVVLRYYLELSEAEMSSVLETPPGTIKWRLHNARKRLRALLREV